MSDAVLILGNGISRLSHVDAIRAYDGEVWGCNYVFHEFPEKLTRLTGHVEPMIEAQEWKEKYGYRYEIYTGVLTKKRPDWHSFTCAHRWLRDSGTSLVAQALHEGRHVIACGFDLGGPDVYAPDQWRVNKESWVRRWAEIILQWGGKRITFWGHDHREYLDMVNAGRRTASAYANKYGRKMPHIPGDEYRDLHEQYVGAPPRPAFDEGKILLEYPNGYRAECKARIARILIDRGEAVPVDPSLMSRDSMGSGSFKESA